MKALEWWPTGRGSDGNLYPRVFIAGLCGHCGEEVVRSALPNELNRENHACRKNHSRYITGKNKRSSNPPTPPKPWVEPEGFDAYIAGGISGFKDWQRQQSALFNPAQPKAPTYLISSDTLEQRRANRVDNAAKAIVKRWAIPDYPAARAFLDQQRPEERDDILAAAAEIIAHRADANKLVHTPGRAPTPVTTQAPPKPRTYTQADISRYYHWRVIVTKNPNPTMEEARRRASCRRPDKVSFEPTTLGQLTAQWHLETIRRRTGQEILNGSVYVCGEGTGDGCGHYHVGRR